MAYTNIDDPSAFFQIALYTGNGGTLAITNDGNSDLQPDWIWIKRRDGAASHNSYDSSRGTGKHLAQNTTDAEQTYHGVTAFNSDGFTLSSGGDMNYNNGTFVGWQWKANGGTTATNNDGSTASTVQVNQDAGFSIITYTGTGSETTFGHGLGVAPEVIIAKKRGGAASWVVWFKAFNNSDGYLVLNATDKMEEATTIFTNTDPTSSVITLGSSSTVNQNTVTHLMYAFAPKQGYSKFGSYVGNSSTDGTFVYLGFKPRWLMIKSTQAGMYWDIIDSARSTSNVMDDYLTANTSDPQGTSATKKVDFLSNGFKLRSNNNINFSDHTFIYMAFAENPFTTSTGIPTTAR